MVLPRPESIGFHQFASAAEKPIAKLPKRGGFSGFTFRVMKGTWLANVQQTQVDHELLEGLVPPELRCLVLVD